MKQVIISIAFAFACASAGAEARELRVGGAIVRSPPVPFPISTSSRR